MTAVTVIAHAEKAEGLRTELTTALRQAGWPEPVWYDTTESDAGQGFAELAVENGAELVVVCGGDGTVNACAAGLAGTGVPMAVVAVGTGNLIAGNLGIPTRRAAAFEVVTTGVDRAIDIGRSGPGVVVGMTGLGLDAAMTAGAPAWLKKRAGWLAYVVSVLRHLPDAGIRVDVDLDGVRRSETGVRALVVGNVGELHGGIRLFPDALPDDGVLDVVLLAPRGLLGWLPVAARLVARRRGSTATVQRFQARHVVARTRHPVAQEADGEQLADDRVLEVAVDPGALLVRVPRPGSG